MSPVESIAATAHVQRAKQLKTVVTAEEHKVRQAEKRRYHAYTEVHEHVKQGTAPLLPAAKYALEELLFLLTGPVEEMSKQRRLDEAVKSLQAAYPDLPSEVLPHIAATVQDTYR